MPAPVKSKWYAATVFVGRACIKLAPFALVGYGAFRAWPPAAPIAVGLMLYIDLTRNAPRAGG